MQSFLDETTQSSLKRLESRLDPYVLASIKIKMQDRTRISFLEGLLSIKQWIEENKKDLLLLNQGKVVEFDQIGLRYVEFLNSLRSVQCKDIGIDSKPWEWFVTQTKDLVLQIDVDTLLSLKKLARMRKVQVREMRKNVKNNHIPLDVVDPESLYSLIRRDK